MTDRSRELADLLAKATPGPWQTSGVRVRIAGQPYLTIDGPKGVVAYIPYSDRTDADHIQSHADQQLIVGAIASLRAQADGADGQPGEVKRLRAALQSLVDVVRHMRVPQNTIEAGVQILLTIGPVLRNAQQALAAAPSTPAPQAVGELAERKTVAKLLRCIANGTRAQEERTDIIFHKAADLIDPPKTGGA